MKMPSFRRIITNDYDQESKNLVAQLAVSINNGFDVLYQALSKRLTFGDNFICTEVTVELTVDANGIPTSTTGFKLDTSQTNTKVYEVQVRYAENLTNTGTYPTSAPWVSWVQTQTGISIVHVSGLQTGNLYRLLLRAL